jgi:hypothetical protein
VTSQPRTIQSCHITWQGISIAVTYDANWLNMERHGAPIAHLAVEVPDGQRLPFTETDYRSHFLRPDSIEAEGGPAAYVLAWLDYAARSPEWRRHVKASRQLSLF